VHELEDVGEHRGKDVVVSKRRMEYKKGKVSKYNTTTQQTKRRQDATNTRLKASYLLSLVLHPMVNDSSGA
jgi:hypothetical protein